MFTYYRCDREYAGRLVLPYLLLLSSYIYGFYNFRYSQIEHLYNLTEKVGSCINMLVANGLSPVDIILAHGITKHVILIALVSVEYAL